MFKDLLTIKLRLSIAQYCLISGILISLLGLYSSAGTLKVLDHYANHMTTHDANINLVDTNNGTLIKVGSELRRLEAPLTKQRHPSNRSNSSAETLYNIKAGLMYLWIATFLMIALFIAWLMKNVHHPFNVLTAAIKRLASEEFSKPIKLNGPSNIADTSFALEKLRKQLRQNERRQILFLRHVSHEIKTPLSSIKEGSTLLRDQSLGQLNSEQSQVVEILLRATHDLQRSIENLLNYNGTVLPRNDQNKQLTDITSLIESVLKNHKLSLRKNSISIRRNLSPLAFWVDETQLRTVFDNLISNAIKHAPPSSEVRLWLKRTRSGALEFTIRDQGKGVSCEHREWIFEPFYMGDRSTNSSIKGTGIGLSLARQYVEAHNGSIKLLETRQGATFKVTIPPH